MKVDRVAIAEMKVAYAVNMYKEKLYDSQALRYELNKVGDYITGENTSDKFIMIKPQRR